MSADIKDLPILEYLRTTFQRERIRMGNRVVAVEQGRSTVNIATIERYCERFQLLEKEVTCEIAESVKEHEVYWWLSATKGIGPGLAGCLLAHIDIEKANTVSALWKYSGLAVTDGVADRPTKGQKLPYNAELKRICFLIGSSFLRANSPYRDLYDEAKAHYQRTKPDWTLKHRDMSARRKMTKTFLSHLWSVWRFQRGLPLRQPYAFQLLNHDGYRGPWEFVACEYPHGFREACLVDVANTREAT